MNKRWRITLGLILVVIVGIRLVLPIIILKKLNAYLANFSPVYSLEIGDLSLSFFGLSYEFQNVKAHYKANDSRFFDVDSVRVSVAFRELLNRRILTHILVDDGNFILSRALVEGSKAPDARPKEKATEAAHVLFPVRVAVVEIKNSAIDFADFIRQPPNDRWKASHIEAKILNITPTPENPISFFTLQGMLFDSGVLKVAGKMKKLEDPLAWKVDAEVHNFNLPDTNPMLMRLLPFSFAAGKLDLYSEVRSQHGEMVGYVKPFFKELKILKAKQTYNSLKYFAFEILGALGNSILRKPDDRTVATKINFREEKGNLVVDKSSILPQAVEHGFGHPLTPAIENSLALE